MRIDTTGGSLARRLGWALIALSLLVSLPYLASRWADEARTYRHVALAVDLEEWADLANAHGGDLRAFLAQVRELGVNQLSIKEAKLGRLELSGLLTIYDPLQTPAAPADLALAYLPGHLYIRPASDELFAQLAQILPLRLHPSAVQAARPYIEVRSDPETLRELRGGFSSADLALAAELGFELFLRPANGRGADPLEPLGQLPGVGSFVIPPGTVVLHQGVEVLGFPDGIERMAEIMNEHQLILGVLETPVQLGLTEQAGYQELARLIDYRVVRVHAFGEPELRKLSPPDLVDRSLRGVRDRGIGVLFLKAIPALTEQYAWEPLTSRSLQYYGGLTADLADQRYQVGPARGSGVTDRTMAGATGLAGAIGGALLLVGALLDYLRLSRRLWWLVMLAPLALLPLGFLARLAGGTSLMREFAAFAIAVTIPAAAVVLAGGWLAGGKGSVGGQPITRGLRALAGATLLGIVGGGLVAATLSGPLYTLEFAYFRGVKVAHLLPLVIAVTLGILAWWRREEDAGLSLAGLVGRIRDLLTSPLTWGAAAFVGLAGISLLMILGRSGHTAGFQVSRVEVALRDLFDVRLYARPRFKEILLGHPALLYLAWLVWASRGRWGWIYALGLGAAAVGQVSVVNSFSHIRTPLIVSLVRTVNGFWVGALLAVAGLAAGLLAWRVLQWVSRDR